ncbi:MAG TPA: type II toxin-antitoxin system prevent-host-death family antitoxin [Acetobacteraceae bacterium]|jgi:prevent-host-death family protein|nr:type II toxin-antitoxin system prevent-host-death family antitoxin [Acetobacteraceae bacterium]
METVNIYEAKTQLSRLVDRAAAGEEIVIARAGKPLVRLVPVDAKQPRRAGLWGHVKPPPNDFFDPLSEEELALFEIGPIEPE